MAPDPRLSDKELAAINAAAVTQEYRVQPHLGRCRTVHLGIIRYCTHFFVRLPNSIGYQWVSICVTQVSQTV